MRQAPKNKAEQYGDMFTLSRDARLWSDLYDRPTKLFHHHMVLRRDYALAYAEQNVARSALVLDLGCGAGILLEGLMDAGYTPVGIEPSSDMLDLARSRLARFGEGRCRLLQAGCESIPCADDEFDAVLCLGVFGYLDDVDGALKEIRRVLKPGGLFLMSIRNRTNVIVSDPPWAIRWIAGRCWRWVTGRGRERGTPSPERFQIDIQDWPRKVIPGVERLGFRLESFDGFGWGPLSFRGRQLLPLSLNIALSDFFNRLFRMLGLSAASAWAADVSMYSFRKA